MYPIISLQFASNRGYFVGTDILSDLTSEIIGYLGISDRDAFVVLHRGGELGIRITVCLRCIIGIHEQLHGGDGQHSEECPDIVVLRSRSGIEPDGELVQNGTHIGYRSGEVVCNSISIYETVSVFCGYCVFRMIRTVVHPRLGCRLQIDGPLLHGQRSVDSDYVDIRITCSDVLGSAHEPDILDLVGNRTDVRDSTIGVERHLHTIGGW